MSSVIGKNIQYSLFGESHGKVIGMTIHSLPAGLLIDHDLIKTNLQRRASGKIYTSQRREEDKIEWLSGIMNDKTTGAPLTFIIKNKDARSKDYSKLANVIRPSHADYGAFVKYQGYNDQRGGGIFSGRLTAALVVAGSIAKQILSQEGIVIDSRLVNLGGINIPYDAYPEKNSDYQSLAKEYVDKIVGKLEQLIEEKDALGGQVMTKVYNLKAGIGDPYFYSLESVLSAYLFSISGLKAIAFGLGEEFANAKASQVNDAWHYQNDRVMPISNNNGGILGGISTGAEIVFKCTFKATPSIARPQKSVNLAEKSNVTIQIEGRHDPAYVLRTAVVVESVTAMALADILKGAR